jgi:hypothetical protein
VGRNGILGNHKYARSRRGHVMQLLCVFTGGYSIVCGVCCVFVVCRNGILAIEAQVCSISQGTSDCHGQKMQDLRGNQREICL